MFCTHFVSHLWHTASRQLKWTRFEFENLKIAHSHGDLCQIWRKIQILKIIIWKKMSYSRFYFYLKTSFKIHQFTMTTIGKFTRLRVRECIENKKKSWWILQKKSYFKKESINYWIRQNIFTSPKCLSRCVHDSILDVILGMWNNFFVEWAAQILINLMNSELTLQTLDRPRSCKISHVHCGLHSGRLWICTRREGIAIWTNNSRRFQYLKIRKRNNHCYTV